MRLSQTAGFVSAAILLAACSSAPPRPVAVAEVEAADDTDSRVTVNLQGGVTQDDDRSMRIVVSAVRAAQRSGSLNDYIHALSTASCPQGGATLRAGEAIDISAAPVALKPAAPNVRKLGGVTYVAGYELNSSDPRFGGLSGVEVLDDGNLLAVSDAGYFIWIDLDSEGVQPKAMRLSTMRDANGAALSGIAGDSAEGIAVNGGMALVSFEGNHRVLAFDVGKCGAAARGAPIVFGNYGMPLSEAYEEARIAVGANNGSEPLAVTEDWFVFAGIEKKSGLTSSLSARPIESEPEFDLRVGVNAPEFAGIDVIPAKKGNGAVRAFLIHRAPGAKGAVWITETDLHRYEDRNRPRFPAKGEMEARSRLRYAETGWRELAQLDQFGVHDQFEGIAARELSDGRARLYLVSDDDYSADKRSLLMIFDVPRPLR